MLRLLHRSGLLHLLRVHVLMAEGSKETKRYSARSLAYDAIFCGVIVVFSLLFSGLAYMARSAFGVVIAAMIGFYFKEKPAVRTVTACAAMALLLLILQGVVLAVSVFLPNILGGLIVSFALRSSGKIYYLVSMPALTLVAAGEYWLVSTLMLGGDLFDRVRQTVEKYDFFTIPQGKETLYFTGAVLAFCVGVGVIKSLICRKFQNIVEKSFPKLRLP